jgi:hypothetical protein
MTQRTIEPVSRALRLNEAERDYLYVLVRREAPAPRTAKVLHPSIEFTLTRAAQTAVLVYDPWLTRLRANDIAREILLIDEGEPLLRNVLWRTFVDPYLREISGGSWEEHARRNLGLFRNALARDPCNPEALQILDALSRLAIFQETWAAHDVYSFRMYSEDSMTMPYLIHNSHYGTLAVHTLIVEIPGWPGAHVRYLTPADEKTVDAFRAAATNVAVKKYSHYVMLYFECEMPSRSSRRQPSALQGRC